MNIHQFKIRLDKIISTQKKILRLNDDFIKKYPNNSYKEVFDQLYKRFIYYPKHKNEQEISKGLESDFNKEFKKNNIQDPEFYNSLKKYFLEINNNSAFFIQEECREIKKYITELISKNPFELDIDELNLLLKISHSKKIFSEENELILAEYTHNDISDNLIRNPDIYMSRLISKHSEEQNNKNIKLSEEVLKLSKKSIVLSIIAIFLGIIGIIGIAFSGLSYLQDKEQYKNQVYEKKELKIESERNKTQLNQQIEFLKKINNNLEKLNKTKSKKNKKVINKTKDIVK